MASAVTSRVEAQMREVMAIDGASERRLLQESQRRSRDSSMLSILLQYLQSVARWEYP